MSAYSIRNVGLLLHRPKQCTRVSSAGNPRSWIPDSRASAMASEPPPAMKTIHTLHAYRWHVRLSKLHEANDVVHRNTKCTDSRNKAIASTSTASVANWRDPCRCVPSSIKRRCLHAYRRPVVTIHEIASLITETRLQLDANVGATYSPIGDRRE